MVNKRLAFRKVRNVGLAATTATVLLLSGEKLAEQYGKVYARTFKSEFKELRILITDLEVGDKQSFDKFNEYITSNPDLYIEYQKGSYERFIPKKGRNIMGGLSLGLLCMGASGMMLNQKDKPNEYYWSAPIG